MAERDIVDLANIVMDDVETKLNDYLQELEQKTTAQIVVLTIVNLNGKSIENLSLEIMEKWKIGQKGRNNGALLLIALKEKKYRFETGYGLEGVLPAIILKKIGQDCLVPFFKKSDYSSGIDATIEAVILAFYTTANA